MTKCFMVILLFLSANAFSQKTNMTIEGVSVFKLGDSITQINNYGYDFRELFIDVVYNFFEKYQFLDSGKNFCSNARVFYCDKVSVDEFEFSQGARLTYFNNRLIDIRLHEVTSIDQITDLLKLKYGLTFGKIFLDGYRYNKLKYQAKGVKITPAIDKQLQDKFLSSVYWTNGNNSISVGGSNRSYDFAERKYQSANLGEYGVSVTNNKEYEKLIACSNLGYRKRLNEYLEKLKQKSNSF